MQITRLKKEDLAALRAMNALFGAVFEEPQTYAGAPPSDAYLQDLLADETFIALAAIREGALVGGLAAFELRKFEQERREIYLYDLAVEAAHRRRGVATALIEALRDIAVVRGAWTVFVQADVSDAPAIALYEEFGRRESVLHFDIRPRRDTS